MSWTDQVRRNAFSPSVHMAALAPTGRIRFNFLPQHQRNHQAQRPPNSSKPDFPFPVAKYPSSELLSSSLHQLRTRLFDQSKRGLWFQPLSRLDFRPALSRIDGCAGHPSPFRGFLLDRFIVIRKNRAQPSVLTTDRVRMGTQTHVLDTKGRFYHPIRIIRHLAEPRTHLTARKAREAP